MVVTWTVVETTPLAIRLAADGAMLLIARSAPDDADLCGVIARFAPHLSFGPPMARGMALERTATHGEERVVVGRLVRGTASVTYVLASRDPFDVDDVLLAHLAGADSPFAHIAD